MSGWFAVKRGITSHPMFKGRPERLIIWMWLLDNAAWKDTKQDVQGKIVAVPRGSVLASERRIAEECGVGYQVVRTFIARLKTERMINAQVTQGRTLISLVNWASYQVPERNPNAAPSAKPTQGQRTKGTREQEITEEANASSGADGAAPVDFLKVVFDQGIVFLARYGTPEKAARSLIGKWRKDAGDTETFNAIRDAQREGVTEPVAWITARLKPQADQSEALKAIFDQAMKGVMQ